MSPVLRHVAARLQLSRRNVASGRRRASTSASNAVLDAVPPTFIQTPPLWVRYAWPLIIGNALLLASAVDITWNHWSTLVKDLEAVAERNKQKAAAAAVEAQRNLEGQADMLVASSPSTIVGETTESQNNNTLITEPSLASSPTPIPPPTANADQSKKDESTPRWERRPTWQRTVFCGVYVVGWAFSTAYLLKYRSTYITRVKFFRKPSSSKVASTLPPPPTPSPTTPGATATTATTKLTSDTAAIIPPEEGPLKNRFIHIETTSEPKGTTIPLHKLSLYEGRNETELVIRSNSLTPTKSKWSSWSKTSRQYWFMNLSGALVDGTRFTQVESARDKIVSAWFGHEDGKKGKKKRGKKHSPVVS